MTITLQNVDNQFLEELKNLVALKPSVTIKEEKRDTIKENLLKDIELIRADKMKTYTLDEMKEISSKW